jgi:hypothetical protein
MLRKLGSMPSFIISLLVISCSVIKTEDPEQKVRTFLSTFQNHLAGTDDQILEHFKVDQSRDAIISIVRILQNKESHIISTANFGQATLTNGEAEIQVSIPVILKVQSAESSDSTNVQLVLWLKQAEQSFVIFKLEGEEPYKAFMALKNNNEWAIQRQQALDERLWVYEKARELESKFDSVIWFCTYGNEKYFYVAEGEWTNYFLNYDDRNKRNETAKIGLINNAGEIVIPIEYEMIGTIGFDHPGIVEISKDGKFGYFDINKKQVVLQPQYDVIIPITDGDNLAVVKTDTTFGWISSTFEYHEGFPSTEVQQRIEGFKYLPANLRLSAETEGICEIPLQDQAGNGIVIPSSYLVANGLFNRIESGICTTGVPMNGWTEYKETKGTWLQTISDGISALVTSISERYLEGREEFYNSSKIVFVNKTMDTLSVTQISGTELSMRAIDSTLLEVRTPHEWWFMENEVCLEENLMEHTYFRISEDGSVEKQKSHRLFPETEFVKLDSSYVTGEFFIYNSEQKANITTHVLSLLTLTSMRDEILASYGYSFPGRDDVRFSEEWYKPEYDNIEQFRESMTDIDKHNLQFLEKMISAVQNGSSGV